MNCPKCFFQMDDDYIYCGNCGAYIKSSQSVIIDGKKNGRIKSFMNKNLSSKRRNTILLVLWIVISVFLVLLAIDCIKDINIFNQSISEMQNQLYEKYKYVKEGLSLKYISKELSFIINYYSNWIYLIDAAVIFLFSLFYIWYYGINLFMRIKFKGFYLYKRPLSLNKIYIIICKTTIVLSALLIAILFLNIIINLIIGVL